MINKNKYIYISSNYSPNNYKKYILFRILKKSFVYLSKKRTANTILSSYT